MTQICDFFLLSWSIFAGPVTYIRAISVPHTELHSKIRYMYQNPFGKSSQIYICCNSTSNIMSFQVVPYQIYTRPKLVACKITILLVMLILLIQIQIQVMYAVQHKFLVEESFGKFLLVCFFIYVTRHCQNMGGKIWQTISNLPNSPRFSSAKNLCYIVCSYNSHTS